ncbi:hypothetical protein L7F22_037196 [Adiantum nelumboides]|nr:hypothetical protein [Adiantum nelumboides]
MATTTSLSSSSGNISVPSAPPLRVQVASFNCNLQGSSAVAPDLSHWLVPTLSEKDARFVAVDEKQGRPAPDIYAVGFQELVDLPDGFSGNAAMLSAIKRTDLAIRRAIRPQAATTRPDGMYPPGGGPEDYTLLAEVHLVGIVLFVYARERAPVAGLSGPKSAVERVKEVRASTAGTGLLGLMGNKGAAGVRVVLEGAFPGMPDETLTFVCAHLAAHDHNVPRRNNDWKNIVRRLVFDQASVRKLPALPITPSQGGKKSTDKEEDEEMQGLTEKYETEKSARSQSRKPVALDSDAHSIYDTSHLFVFGDLNYRIGFNTKPSAHLARKGQEDVVLKRSDVKRKINQADWKTLATYDQLAAQHRPSDGGSKAFHGLVEPDIRTWGHGPTYKFKVDKVARKQLQKQQQTEGGDNKEQPGVAPVTGHNAGELSGKRVPGWTDRILWASAGSASDDLQGVTPELYRSIMRYTHSDHKPVTAILRLSPPASSNAHLDPSTRPFGIDGAYRTKALLGLILDRILGYIWSALVTAGAGNVIVGILELVGVAILSVWYLGVGGSQQSDLAYWLGNVLGRP